MPIISSVVDSLPSALDSQENENCLNSLVAPAMPNAACNSSTVHSRVINFKKGEKSTTPKTVIEIRIKLLPMYLFHVCEQVHSNKKLWADCIFKILSPCVNILECFW